MLVVTLFILPRLIRDLYYRCYIPYLYMWIMTTYTKLSTVNNDHSIPSSRAKRGNKPITSIPLYNNHQRWKASGNNECWIDQGSWEVRHDVSSVWLSLQGNGAMHAHHPQPAAPTHIHNSIAARSWESEYQLGLRYSGKEAPFFFKGQFLFFPNTHVFSDPCSSSWKRKKRTEKERVYFVHLCTTLCNYLVKSGDNAKLTAWEVQHVDEQRGI